MTLRRLGAAAALGALVSSALPACSATANVSDVFMSIDEDGARRRNVFFTDSKQITCIAQVGIGRKDVTIEMLIRQIRSAPLGTEDYESIDSVVVANDFHPDLTQDKPALIGLTMVPTSLDEEGRLKEDQEAPFHPGSYVCEVMLDGKPAGTAAFNVQYPDCPAAVIQNGTPCLGFYRLGDPCPANGATGQPDPKCTCEATGWSCQ